VQIDYRWCSTCSSKQLFEQPPCEDGHGDDCLDLACMECGFGIALRDLSPAAQARKDVDAA
jgi:hypothetical protein